jgi:hypothetical protein
MPIGLCQIPGPGKFSSAPPTDCSLPENQIRRGRQWHISDDRRWLCPHSCGWRKVLSAIEIVQNRIRKGRWRDNRYRTVSQAKDSYLPNDLHLTIVNIIPIVRQTTPLMGQQLEWFKRVGALARARGLIDRSYN